MSRRCVGLGICLLLALVAPAYPEGALPGQADSKFIAERLVGTWRLAPELSERLTSSQGGSFELFTIAADPSILASAPAAAKAAAGTDSIALTGTLISGDTRFLFLLAGNRGTKLVCYRQPRTEGAEVKLLSIHVALIPARERGKDLLFLGGESLGEPFFAYEREKSEASKSLSQETQQLLQEALRDPFSPARLRLPAQPDWQAVVDSILDEFRLQPEGAHNNRLLILSAVLAEHRSEARLDLDPLLAVVASRTWTNQQKGAYVLAALRRDLFTGKEEQVCRVLIPLTTSQRGSVVAPALQVLHVLSGSTRLQRDPIAWSAWFEKTYGKKLPLEGAVYELACTIQARDGSSGQQFYSFNGGPPVGADALKRELKNHVQVAEAHGLNPAFIVLVPMEIHSAATQNEALTAAESGRKILEELGFKDFTVVPERTEFYEPFNPGFPRSQPLTKSSAGEHDALSTPLFPPPLPEQRLNTGSAPWRAASESRTYHEAGTLRMHPAVASPPVAPGIGIAPFR